MDKSRINGAVSPFQNMEYFESSASVVSDTQIIHNARQITNIDKLVEGGLYKRIHIQPDGKEYDGIIFRIIAISQKGRIKIQYFSKKGYEFVDSELFLEDVGIIPYRDSKWNAVNYIVLVY